jgi:hypothetical protein
MGRYWALQIISIVQRIIGFIVIIGSLVTSVVIVAAPSAIYGGREIGTTAALSLTLPGALIVLIAGVLAGTGIYAYGQFIMVILDIERNTRATRRYLMQKANPAASPNFWTDDL